MTARSLAPWTPRPRRAPAPAPLPRREFQTCLADSARGWSRRTGAGRIQPPPWACGSMAPTCCNPVPTPQTQTRAQAALRPEPRLDSGPSPYPDPRLRPGPRLHSGPSPYPDPRLRPGPRLHSGPSPDANHGIPLRGGTHAYDGDARFHVIACP
eukprot:2416570-Pyramimonas_sp.AAC.1